MACHQGRQRSSVQAKGVVSDVVDTVVVVAVGEDIVAVVVVVAEAVGVVVQTVAIVVAIVVSVVGVVVGVHPSP